MDKLAFVILHYKDYSMTHDSVLSILNQNYNNFEIIIVDNDSRNGSFEKLKEEFKNDENISLIGIEANVGFAKANNLGYQFAKHKLNASTIIIMNNDVILSDPEFCNKLLNSESYTTSDIIGPDIITKDGFHQNPHNECITDLKTLEKTIVKNKIKLILIPIFYNFRKIKKTKSKVHKEYKNENIPLHGACLIFTHSFIDKHEFAFYPDTFLYGEEEFLYYLSKKENLKLNYEPSLQVLHMEDVSTNHVYSDNKEKRIFEIKNQLDSFRLLANKWKSDLK